MINENNEGNLTGLHVLDMTQGGSQICGKLLADLGADVIKVEPPGGDPTRYIGPFYKDIVDPQKSLFWFAYNTSKRGITLNIETSDGRQIFKRLAKDTDILIESFAPGYLDNLGVGYQDLRQLNPGIIVTSITPFGQTGPKAHYKSCDLISSAGTDGIFSTGDVDRPPVWISFPQPSLHAGVEACAGTMIAYWQKVKTGKGQHVDVSIQDTFIWSTEQAHLQMYETTGYVYHRSGNKTLLWTGVGRSSLFPCKDGFVVFTLAGGAQPNAVASTKSLVRWMSEEGMAPDWLVNYDWENDFDTSRLTQEEVDRVEKEFEEFFMTKTKAELFDNAFKRGVLLAPSYTVEDISKSEHLKARNYWIDVEHDELDCTLTYCGVLNNSFSKTPARIKCRAPLIGEHNLDIYKGTLGFGSEELNILKGSGVI